MNHEMKNIESLRLVDPVVIRRVPMTAEGSDMLRAIRRYQTEGYARAGKNVEIPFPVTIHLVLKEFCEIKGIKV